MNNIKTGGDFTIEGTAGTGGDFVIGYLGDMNTYEASMEMYSLPEKVAKVQR